MSNMEDGGDLAEGGLVVKGRTSIDTRRPFKSVKEAVSLFGEVVLAGEVYANVNNFQQQQTQTKRHSSSDGTQKNNTNDDQEDSSRDKAWRNINAELTAGTKTIIGSKKQLSMHHEENNSNHQHHHREKEAVVLLESELEETKASLQRAREEGELMSTQLHSLQNELDGAKTELQRLKSQKHYHNTHHIHIQQLDHSHPHHEEVNETSPVMLPEIEEIKFVENNHNNNNNNNYADEWTKQGNDDDDDDGFEFPQTKKMQVRFASPRSLTREFSSSSGGPNKAAAVVVDKAAGSFRKEMTMSASQKKGSVSFVGWIFPKRKTKKTTTN